MATRILKFRVKATVQKIEEVEVEIDGKTDEEIENEAREMASSQFNILPDGTEEKYEEDYTLIQE